MFKIGLKTRISVHNIQYSSEDIPEIWDIGTHIQLFTDIRKYLNTDTGNQFVLHNLNLKIKFYIVACTETYT